MTDQRPDPDLLLASLQRNAGRAQRGKLRVFFGMSPGVGKTYAMLRAAQQERADGVNVVVGVVETHGRTETEALLAGLLVVPRKQTQHAGIQISEFDLESVLIKKPQLVLVDELAHTNAPASRHPKRYQDVVELLEAGIDVFTTMNVQHLESRADTVRQITGATVHETVPDSIIELAEQIEIVDLTPEALRERLADGKVYTGDRAAVAAENFFKDANLLALRELALRFVAERVDKRLRELRTSTGPQTIWRSGERILVAVGPSPFSTQLVRWTRRLAAALGAPWVAVYVETSKLLAPERQRVLDRNLALARELGAEVIHTHDDDIPGALVRIALQHNATQIVIGKSNAVRWLDSLRGGSLVDRLIRLGGAIDISLVPAETERLRLRSFDLGSLPDSGWNEYGLVLGVLAGITFFAKFLPPAYYLAVGLIYLLAVILLSLKVGRWPVLLAGCMSALTWDYLFIPPKYTFVINRFEDALLFGTYFAVALVSGQLAARIRAQARHEHLRELRATALFRLTRALAEAKTLDEAVFGSLRQIDQLFKAKSALALVSDNGTELVPHFAGSYPLEEKEKAVAEWAYRHQRTAGRFTETLQASRGFYIPLVREGEAVGVLGLSVDEGEALTVAQRDLLEAFARQLALMVEREHLRAASEREKLFAESEKLHRTLLDSVSHELRTPLAVITAAAENLETAAAEQQGTLLNEIRAATRRLNRLVGNLLDQTRLESGALKPRIDWCDPQDLVNAAIENARDALEGHPLDVVIPPDLTPVRADFALMEQALGNLLLNAALHTPKGTLIFITTGLERAGQRAFFTIADRGGGFPPAMKDRLFKKFARGDAARAGGLGLGLSIVRGFVAAQEGEIVVGENPGGGAVFTIYIPHQAADHLPLE